MSLWERKTISFELLDQMAKESEFCGSMITWLKSVGLIPQSTKWKRGNSTARILSPEAIEIGYLAEVAYDWSLDGPSNPTDFTEALRFELRGT